MKPRIACGGLVWALLVSFAQPAAAQDGFPASLLSILPQSTLDELNLTADQAKQIQGFERRFRQDCMQTLVLTGLKVIAIVDKSNKPDDDSGEPAPGLAITHELTGMVLGMQRNRASYQRKAVALLDERQKGAYRRIVQGLPAEGGRPTSVLNNSLLDKLQLDAEQNRRLDDLRLETERRLRTLLNDQQKKLLDQQLAR